MGKKKHHKPANKNTAKEPAQEGTKAAVAENTLETNCFSMISETSWGHCGSFFEVKGCFGDP